MQYTIKHIFSRLFLLEACSRRQFKLLNLKCIQLSGTEIVVTVPNRWPNSVRPYHSHHWWFARDGACNCRSMSGSGCRVWRCPGRSDGSAQNTASTLQVNSESTGRTTGLRSTLLCVDRLPSYAWETHETPDFPTYPFMRGRLLKILRVLHRCGRGWWLRPPGDCFA
jgi:hypothetical protein